MVGSSRLVVDAWEALFRAQVSVVRDLRDGFTGTGLSMNEYDVLFNVHREPERRIRLRDLNRNVLITQSSVSRLVDRLVARGFLVKCDDESDGRGTVVGLTAEGTAIFRRVAALHVAGINERLGGTLTDDELRMLASLCDRLREAGAERDRRPSAD